MTINFYLDSNKKLKSSRTVWCYVYDKGQTIYINTGTKVEKKYWDATKQRTNLRKTKSTYIKSSLNSVNLILDKYQTTIDTLILNYRLHDLKTSTEKIFEAIKIHFDKSITAITFFGAIDEFIDARENKVSKATLQKYKRMKILLKEFEVEKNYKLTFEKIDSKFHDLYFPFLLSKGMINNSAYKQISFLKVFINWARDERKYTKNSGLSNLKPKYERSEIIYLDEAELMKITNLKLANDRLSRVRDIFVFQCFTGVRYSDIYKIRRTEIKNGFWYLRTKKTHDTLEIPLNSYALAILEKYKEFPTPLPVISNQKMNVYLKELCLLAGITDEVSLTKYVGNKEITETYMKYEVIGTHTARRTFISLAIQRNMNAEVVMSITGHKDYRTMQKYLKISNSVKRDEMDKAFGTILRKVK